MSIPQPQHRTASPSIDALLALTATDLAAVNTLIVEQMQSDVPLIPQLAAHLIMAGGKRIRPLLTLGSALLCGYQGTRHLNLAACVEFIHTATLLHDDVVDDSDLRRGKAAAKNVWGASASILVGDFLFARSFTLMTETRDLRILDILSRASCVIAEGEVRQLAAIGKPDLALPEYMAIVEAKTAALFEAAARAGAYTATDDDDAADAMGEYGRRLGRAFQIVDDLLDYGGLTSVIGKTVGDDFRERKITLPVIYAREAGSAADREFWDRVMGEPDQRDSDLAHAIHLIRATGAAERTLETARTESAAARAALARAARGPCHDELGELADQSVNRAF